ncbi:hypothetical protein ABW19_dt0210189 [Dactylella cylindrospora]|nr:hypothetical protein ABW19_dt0210189 [Dactylella cylindrospora]
MAPIGVAILGSGIFVKKEHKPACLQDAELLSLKAIYSRSKASVEATIAGDTAPVDIYSDDSGEGKGIDDLLKRDDIDFVIVALPILLQPAFIKKALLAGKHVLSEKPVAKDLADANELIKWKKENAPGPIWSVAENFRYMPTFEYAKQQLEGFGRILTFHVEALQYVAPGGDYIETAWRKIPQYQGGFCLDGGVHFTAGLRKLVGADQISQLASFTNLAHPHLLPIDTITSTIKLKSGACGTFALSFGSTSHKQFEWLIVCEGGSVKVGEGGKVTVKKVGEEEVVKEFGWNSGVKGEVKAFAEAVARSKGNEIQSPELAVGDLEMIEKMLKSGEEGGKPLEITGGLA